MPLRLLVCLTFCLLISSCVPTIPRCVTVPRSAPPAPTVLAQAGVAWRLLDHPDPAIRGEALSRYRNATAALFEQLRCQNGGWESAAARLGTVLAEPGPDGVHPASLSGIVAAAEVETDDLGVRHTVGQLGVPVVGWIERHKTQVRPFAPPAGDSMALAAILRFDTGSQPEWHFLRADEVDNIKVGGRTLALAYDFTAPKALYWKMARLDQIALLNVFLPGRYGENGLFLPQPYDPGKIPVVLVHGLQSSPYTFRKLANAMIADPILRDNYQVWFYNYPTGNPWTYSAAIFRQRMRAAITYARSHGGGGTVDDMVIVAHSMGGLLTRASLSYPGTALYERTFLKPVEQLVLPPDVEETFREYYLYEPLKDPARVVFMAVPHRGSPITERYFAHVLTRLIRLPLTLTSAALQVVTLNLEALAATGRDQLPTGIDSLSPRAPAILALQDMPIRDDLKIHSIIGDTGTGGNFSGTDGVVPFWSSHFAASRSERIVDSDHSITGDPAAVDEVKRILHQHLKER